MKPTRYLLILSAFLLQGCLPKLITVHDGLSLTVVDSLTKTPLPNVGVYLNKFGKVSNKPLTLSDAQGRIDLAPKYGVGVEWLIGDRMVSQFLVLCKEGYILKSIAKRQGFSADSLPSQPNKLGDVELSRAQNETDACSLDLIRKEF